MTINKKYSGTFFGAIFTIGSLLLTLTFVIPIISILPGVFIQSIVASFFGDVSEMIIGKYTIITLFILLFVSLSVVLIKVRKLEVKNIHILGVLIFEYFIIHPLGFYCYWAISLNYRSDGQLIFGAVSSFPYSSFGFLLIGILIDLVKNRTSLIDTI